MTEENPSMVVVRKCLKDAGIYDHSMNDEEMLQVYRAIENSKTTALTEGSHIEPEPEPESQPVTKRKEKVETVTSRTPLQRQTKLQLRNKENEPNTTPTIKPFVNTQETDSVYEELWEVNAFDAIPTAHESLKQIIHKPKYDPPFYCNIADDLNDKAKLVARIHLQNIERFAQFQCKSLIPAPWGKPMLLTGSFNGTSSKTATNSEDNENICSQEPKQTYVSQFGRQTKRKVYQENSDSDNDDSKKKLKASTSTTLSSKRKRETTKRTTIEKLKNDEIMKRSKLFLELDPNERRQKMVENLKADEEKKRNAEVEFERLKNSLDQTSDDEVAASESDASCELFDQPIRISPPSWRSKANLKGKKAPRKGKKNATVKAETASPKYTPLPVTPTTTRGSRRKEQCELCFNEYPSNEIIAHRAKCAVLFTEVKDSSHGDSKMVCDICDQTLPLDMNYEVHVRQCIVEHFKSPPN